MKKLRLGIIGYGNMGTAHVSNIMAGKVPNVELTAVCDYSETRRKAFTEQFADIPVFERPEELYQSGLCDAVFIVTYHYEHPSLAIKAFQHGLHVLIEKPAGVYTKQVREMNSRSLAPFVQP